MIKTPSHPDSWLHWMNALAEPTRLRLLALLERHELGVAELCDILQTPQSTVSRHLKVLTQQAWLHSRRQGTTHLYRMSIDELAPSARRLWLLGREQLRQWPAFAQDQVRLESLLAQRRAPGQSFFAGAAGKWQDLRNELYGQSFLRTALLSLLPPEMVVADLGCGSGDLTHDLAPHVARVIGIDASEAMLESARQRLANLNNVELHHADVQALPLADDCCDAALMMLVLSYVEQPRQALSEMARVVRSGGHGVVVDLLGHDREDFRRQMGQQWLGFATAQLTDMMHEAGFEQVQCDPLAPGANEKTRGPALLLARGRKT